MSGYTCPECGVGKVRSVQRANIQTHFEHLPFTVPVGTLEVCDHCGDESYTGAELERWRLLFEANLEATGETLSPAAVRAVRALTGLNMTDFAVLIGTTRQSLHNWERDSREVPQGRMADLMLRLVLEAVQTGSVPVLEFLRERAVQQGASIPMPVSAASPHRPAAPAAAPKRRRAKATAPPKG